MPIMRAHGGLVATAPSMLHLGNTYILGGNAIGSENPTALDEHSGALRAVQTITEQRSDGTVLYIFLNSRWFDNGTSTVEIPLDQLQAAINELLDDGPGEEWSWPETPRMAHGLSQLLLFLISDWVDLMIPSGTSETL